MSDLDVQVPTKRFKIQTELGDFLADEVLSTPHGMQLLCVKPDGEGFITELIHVGGVVNDAAAVVTKEGVEEFRKAAQFQHEFMLQILEMKKRKADEERQFAEIQEQAWQEAQKKSLLKLAEKFQSGELPAE